MKNKKQQRKRNKPLTVRNGGGPINNPDMPNNNDNKAVTKDAEKERSNTSED